MTTRSTQVTLPRVLLSEVVTLRQHCLHQGSLRWLKKSSKEVLSREGICMRFWDGSTSNWLKIYDHVKKTPRWLTFSDLKLLDGSKFEEINISNWVSFRILSHLRVSGLKKWAISEFWHVIVDFEPIWSWAISKSHAYASTWQYLLRWLFEPSQGPRVWFSAV